MKKYNNAAEMLQFVVKCMPHGTNECNHLQQGVAKSNQMLKMLQRANYQQCIKLHKDNLCGPHATKISQCTVSLLLSPKDSQITVTNNAHDLFTHCITLLTHNGDSIQEVILCSSPTL